VSPQSQATGKSEDEGTALRSQAEMKTDRQIKVSRNGPNVRRPNGHILWLLSHPLTNMLVIVELARATRGRYADDIRCKQGIRGGL
jgi:hypothetical protein